MLKPREIFWGLKKTVSFRKYNLSPIILSNGVSVQAEIITTWELIDRHF